MNESPLHARIMVAGATGALGRATLPHLERHQVVGLTRSQKKLALLRALGVEGVVCDVYNREELVGVAKTVRPHIVVNFLTDLSSGNREANNRVRREGGANLVNAAVEGEARRLVVESVSFALERTAADAVEQMERTALNASLDVLILRFARFWGPGTFYSEPPDSEAVHIEEAGARAAKLLTSAPPGAYVIA